MSKEKQGCVVAEYEQWATERDEFGRKLAAEKSKVEELAKHALELQSERLSRHLAEVFEAEQERQANKKGKAP